MANIKSAKKRILVNETKAARNKSIKSGVKTAVKKVDVAVAEGNKEAAVAALEQEARRLADLEAQRRAELDATLRRQQAELAIKRKYGKNAILKGMNFRDGATTRDRNRQIGGHKA
mgnify:CR=1 FL=1